jgi:hypothetical protein
MAKASTFTHKLGKTRAGEGTRIWLEGNRLIAHGFTKGTTCERKWSEGKLVIVTVDAATFEHLPRADRTTVAGTDARPIIDIVGEAVRAAFPGGSIEATWTQGRVTIKAAAS